MKTDYKVGDKVTILPFKAGTIDSRVYYQEMLHNIGLVGTVRMVHDNGVRVKTSAGTWSYHFKFIKPLEETSMTKPTAINVINQSPKVRAKLSKALVSLGYNRDCDYGEGSYGNSTRIYNEYHNHDLGAVSTRSSVSTVDADDLNFKAVLKAVMPLLEFSTARPKVGDSVVVLNNPEGLADVHVWSVGTVVRDDLSTSLPIQIQFPNNKWWFNTDNVRVLKAPDKALTSALPTEAPTATTKPEFLPKFKVGDTVKVVAHDRTRLPMDKTYTVTHVEDVGYTGNLPYRVQSGGTIDWVGHTALELVPEELQQADFKFTRVKVKDTGATGVVIGRGLSSRSVCVQFDMPSAALHNGGALQDYQGADNRCWFHAVEDLEIIGDTHA